MLGDLMTSVQPIEIKIFGDDQKNYRNYRKQVSDIVENVKGTADVFDGIVIAGPSITIQPDYTKIGTIWHYTCQSSISDCKLIWKEM